jgi:undecaprenyl-diphosphatase
MRVRDALIIGVAQGMAILPGLSRSGATISTALFLGIQRKTAGPFSFLLSIPAILGALALEMRSALTLSPVSVKMLLLGTAAAAVTGVFALKLLLRFVNQGRLSVFAPYCWAVGLAALMVSF